VSLISCRRSLRIPSTLQITFPIIRRHGQTARAATHGLCGTHFSNAAYRILAWIKAFKEQGVSEAPKDLQRLWYDLNSLRAQLTPFAYCTYVCTNYTRQPYRQLNPYWKAWGMRVRVHAGAHWSWCANIDYGRHYWRHMCSIIGR